MRSFKSDGGGDDDDVAEVADNNPFEVAVGNIEVLMVVVDSSQGLVAVDNSQTLVDKGEDDDDGEDGEDDSVKTLDPCLFIR